MADPGDGDQLIAGSSATDGQHRDYATHESTVGLKKNKGSKRAVLGFVFLACAAILTLAAYARPVRVPARPDSVPESAASAPAVSVPDPQPEPRVFAKAVAATPAVMEAVHVDHAWATNGAEDLFNMYNDIFPHHNRNAASHRWATFILDRASVMSAKKLRSYFAAFCPVSGSPIAPERDAGWRYDALPRLGSTSTVSGVVRHCCSPCVCDTQAHLKVDTQVVTTKDGPVTFDFLVMGDPCGDPGRIPQSAPDVNCFTPNGQKAARLDCNLAGEPEHHPCWESENGGVIVGMLLSDRAHDNNSDAAMMLTSWGTEPMSPCEQRAAAGTQSGMGTIFIEVASINPL